jgi:hypothetical protein
MRIEAQGSVGEGHALRFFDPRGDLFLHTSTVVEKAAGCGGDVPSLALKQEFGKKGLVKTHSPLTITAQL